MWDLYCLWAARPCLSWSGIAMRALTWVIFVPRALRQCCALVAPHRCGNGLTYRMHKKFPRSVFMKYLNALIRILRYMATNRHTHNLRKCSHASVGLTQARPNYVTLLHVYLRHHISISVQTLTSQLSPSPLPALIGTSLSKAHTSGTACVCLLTTMWPNTENLYWTNG